MWNEFSYIFGTHNCNLLHEKYKVITRFPMSAIIMLITLSHREVLNNSSLLLNRQLQIIILDIFANILVNSNFY